MTTYSNLQLIGIYYRIQALQWAAVKDSEVKVCH